MKEALKEALAEFQREKRPRSVPFSDVSERQARQVYRQLNIPLVDGNDLYPITLPSNSFVHCGSFDMASYPNEDEASEPFLFFIQSSLSKQGTKFGPGGFKMLDLHKQPNLYQLTFEDRVYRGGLDGAIVPFGVSAIMPEGQLRCAIEVKLSSKHKAEYKQRHGKQAEGAAADLSFTGTVQGQALLEALAACIYAEYPSVLLLLSSFDHNSVIEWRSGRVTLWQGISFDEAMYKVDGFLKSCSADCFYQWGPGKQLPESLVGQDEQQQGDELLRQLRKRLRPSSVALEQLDSLTAGMDQQQKLCAALEYFAELRQQGDSWQCMFG
jgi:hypothetical protein